MHACMSIYVQSLLPFDNFSEMDLMFAALRGLAYPTDNRKRQVATTETIKKTPRLSMSAQRYIAVQILQAVC